ncbi:MAG: hypothetical protein R2752_12655 [Vicinamibacterales bacterium]
MTWHPDDDDLILRHFGEADAGLEARIDAHLAGCDRCRGVWHEITDTLALAGTVEVPEPGEGFERVMWARVQAALPPPPSAGWSAGFLRFWMPAATLTAAVAVALALAIRPSGPDVPDAPGRAADARERVLLTALDGHFEQAEMLLVEVMNAPADDAGDLEFQRETAEDLVASGRLYRVTAEETGDVGLVRMLEDLEPVLVDLARSPKTLDAHDLESLRTRIGDEDLLFKVRAVNGEIRGRQQTMNAVSEGPL